MKRAIGYVRVSTKEQSELDKFGIEAQKEAILKYAEENDFEIFDWRIDVASGVSEEKKELNDILYTSFVSNPPFQAVIVFKSDRISRDMKQYFYSLYLLERKGVELVSVQEDFEGELANVYRALMLFCAEQERKNINIRTSSGRNVKANKGGYAGGRCPYGYNSVGGNLIVDPEEAEVVKLVFHLKYDLGLAYNKIAEKLDEQGFLGKSGGKFNSGGIYYIIQNKHFYEGYIKYGKQGWRKGVHEPIIQEGMFLVPND